ncbi:alpha/beta hydrolase [Mesorhizobium sp. KR2-14]|uniref:alpha/beta hydrolase n=1 Tax=Mesorhizobium sp. KR2-14 TaxID=3156610 RepID=UPI0032B5BF67
MTDFLYDIPENPRPEKGVSGFLTRRDGKRLRYARFAATTRPLHGTVVLLPGRNESIEKYFETIRDLARRGFGVATLDWRGQGGSDRLLRDGARGHVRSFDDYVHDLEQLFTEIVLPDCRGPYYILAHSTGALVALLAAPSLSNRVRRMVLLAPFLALYNAPLSMKALGRVASICYGLGLGRLYAPGTRDTRTPVPFASNVLTSDPQRYERNGRICAAYPQLALGGPTVAWIRAASKAIARVSEPEFMARIQIPTLLIAAGADKVVSSHAVEDYARRLRVGSLLTIYGARHEILQESDFYREQFLAAFDAFIPGSDAPTGH